MTRFSIAIIGHGFVGGAVDYGFPDSKNCNKTLIDPKYGTSVKDLRDKNIDISFVCVPTPMEKNASIDASILITAVNELLVFTESLIVIKSTVTPSIIEVLTQNNPRVLYNPEFLTEKSANEDFVNPVMHVFGGERSQTEKLESIYKDYSACRPCSVFHTTAVEASFIKYGINSFLASKVLFFNQLHTLVEAYGSANYNIIRNAIGTDSRIGHSHTMVPGHDGRKGFGGSCFVKDTAAFAMFANSLEPEHSLTLLEEAIRQNQKIRSSYGEPLERERQMNVRFDYTI